MIKFGIADYFAKKLIYDVNRVSFSFLFDESTNNQVKKQFDGNVSYWPLSYDQVVSAYAGSLFLGLKSELKSDYLLHLGTDGPNVSLSFENKLGSNLESINTSFLRIGTCSLHPTHIAFRKGIKSLYSNTINISGEKESTFDLDDFFNYLHFFFKLSSARRENYASLENVTNMLKNM